MRYWIEEWVTVLLRALGVFPSEPPQQPEVVVYVGEMSWRGEILVMRHETSPAREWSSELRRREEPLLLAGENPPASFDWGRMNAGAELLAVSLFWDAAGRAPELDERANVIGLVQSLARQPPSPPLTAISGETVEHGWAESWRLTREDVLRAAGAPLPAELEAAWAVIGKLERLSPGDLTHLRRFAQCMQRVPAARRHASAEGG